MLFIKRSIFFLAFSQAIFAADIESQDWQLQVEELSHVSVSEQVKKVVLDDLLEWGPDQTSSFMQFPLWFWDIYLEDEAFRGIIRAYFLPSFTENCYELVTGQSLECPLDAIAHASEIGIEAMRVAKKVPYLLFSEYRSEMLANFTWRGSARSCTAMLSHWSAVADYTCTASASAYAGNPVGWFASVVTGQIFKVASVAFAGATAFLAMDGEFMDVALRSMKRKYEMQNRLDEVAVVSMMIAHRNPAEKKHAD